MLNARLRCLRDSYFFDCWLGRGKSAALSYATIRNADSLSTQEEEERRRREDERRKREKEDRERERERARDRESGGRDRRRNEGSGGRSPYPQKKQPYYKVDDTDRTRKSLKFKVKRNSGD